MWITLKHGGQGCFLVSRTGRSPKDVFQRFLYDLEMKTRERSRTEMERFDWFIERIQTRVAFGWLSERSGEKTSRPRTRNQSILRPDVIMQHDWPIEQCLLHIRVFFGGKTKRSCFDLFIHWLIKQITNTYRNQFSRKYENRSIKDWKDPEQKLNHQLAWESIAGCWGKGEERRAKSSPYFPLKSQKLNPQQKNQSSTIPKISSCKILKLITCPQNLTRAKKKSVMHGN